MKHEQNMTKILSLGLFFWMFNLEANREVHKVKIQVVQLQSLQGFVQTRRHVRWGVMSAPELQRERRGREETLPPPCTVLRTHLTADEHVLAPDDALLHLGEHSFANGHLVAVTVRGVYVAVAGSDGRLCCSLDQ